MTLPVEHIQNLEITVTGIFRYTDTWPAAIHLVASGQVDLDSLVTGRSTWSTLTPPWSPTWTRTASNPSSTPNRSVPDSPLGGDGPFCSR